MANQDVVIPSSPADREKIRRVMCTISDSLTRIEAERDIIKDELNALVEEFEIPKKFLSKMSRTYHRQNFQDLVGESDDFQSLYETVLELNKS